MAWGRVSSQRGLQATSHSHSVTTGFGLRCRVVIRSTSVDPKFVASNLPSKSGYGSDLVFLLPPHLCITSHTHNDDVASNKKSWQTTLLALSRKQKNRSFHCNWNLKPAKTIWQARGYSILERGGWAHVQLLLLMLYRRGLLQEHWVSKLIWPQKKRSLFVTAKGEGGW